MTVFVQIPDFWASQLYTLAPRASEASDPAQFMHLCVQGSDALESDDIDQLRRICVELWNLLPHEAGETFGAGFSGITR